MPKAKKINWIAVRDKLRELHAQAADLEYQLLVADSEGTNADWVKKAGKLETKLENVQERISDLIMRSDPAN